MTMAIVYRQELALLLSRHGGGGRRAFAVGHGLQEFFLLTGAAAAAMLNLGRIRTRSKLIYVGLFAGGVAALLTVGHGHHRQPADQLDAVEKRRYAADCGPWRPASS